LRLNFFYRIDSCPFSCDVIINHLRPCELRTSEITKYSFRLGNRPESLVKSSECRALQSSTHWVVVVTSWEARNLILIDPNKIGDFSFLQFLFLCFCFFTTYSPLFLFLQFLWINSNHTWHFKGLFCAPLLMYHLLKLAYTPPLA